MHSTHVLWYKKPAALWTEALPIGNGRIGAMVFGNPENDRFALNEDTLWSGTPHQATIAGGPEALKQARQLMDKGKFHEAQRLVEQRLSADDTQNYLPLGDLEITRSFPEGTQDYRRELNLETGVHTLRFVSGGVRHQVRSFVGAPQPQCLAVEFSADAPGNISLSYSLTSPLKNEIFFCGDDLAMDTECPGRQSNPRANTVEAVPYFDDPALRGICARTRVVCLAQGGKIARDENRVTVEGADRVTLLLCVRTSFSGWQKSPFLEGADYVSAVEEEAAALKNTSFDALLKAHEADFSSYMNRVDFHLDARESDLPTDERLETAKTAHDDMGLYELLFQFGRYLMVSSSRPGTQATNLQGIWNASMTPPWRSNYTVNINTEMNYYPAEIANLSEMHGPLFDLIDRTVEHGKTTAQNFYGMRGSVCHHNTDLWGLTNPVGVRSKGCAVWSFWPMALPWLCRDLYEHYEYTLDLDFLENRALPALRQVVLFCLDFLAEDEKGYLRVYPATSPENHFIYQGEDCAVARSATCSNALIRGIFQDYLDALKELRLSEPLAEEVAAALPRIRPYEFGSKGQILEWDAEYEEAEPHHRHTSHLVGLYPGKEITVDTPELAEGARRTLEMRGDDGTGWSLGWKICFWARLRDGDHALRLLNNQLRPVHEGEKYAFGAGGGTYPNMLDAHPPFQIDGNFGASAGIAEMLLYSRPGEITLLPALPSLWKDGCVKGLKAKGNCSVDITFRGGKPVSAEIDAPDARALPIQIVYAGETVARIEKTGVTHISF